MTQKRAFSKKNKTKPDPKALLDWYDAHARVLPWRAPSGVRPNPYHVWLSEIMLQQTTVAAVGPYFMKFLDRWPTLSDLAASDLNEVFQMWAGLGYYRRARGLHACAHVIAHDFGGAFPRTEKELLALPGIGPYTAAAIMAIAFDEKANVVDGNVERVMARFYDLRDPLPGVKPQLKSMAAQSLPSARYGDYAQALMDLGATVCTPKSPKCSLCPWAKDCAGRRAGTAPDLPARSPSKVKPQRYGVAFVLTDGKGAVFLQQRPDTGLLASMMEVPSTPWLDAQEKTKSLAWAKAQRYAPAQSEWQLLKTSVHHTFTHFDLELGIAVAQVPRRPVKGLWVMPGAMASQALPSVMRKVLTASRKTK